MDISNLIIELRVYGDVMVPGFNCEIVLLEGYDLLSFLPLVGQETLALDFNAPDIPSFSYTFAIAKMEEVKVANSLKVKAYKLVGVNPDVFQNQSTIIQKTYNTTNDAIVQDLISSMLGSSKSVNTEATQGIQQYPVQNQKPFDAVLDVLKRSCSAQFLSSSYLFFENQQGYNFLTMENLFTQGPVATFTNYTVTNDSIFRSNFRNVLGYELPKQFDTPMLVGQGAFASQLKVMDLKTMLFTNILQNPDVASMVRGMPNLTTSGLQSQFGQTPGASNYLPKDMTRPDTYIDQFIANQKAYIAQIDQSTLKLVVYGDSTLDVGQVIDVELQTATEDTFGNVLPSPLIAGNYLITKICHIIRAADERPRYLINLEGVTGGYASGV